jgi:multiple sugar transport system substrate-binding protein
VLPPMRRLIDSPFWLDPSDRHRMRAAIQTLTQPHSYSWWGQDIMAKAIHRTVTEGISPEQAVDEAIARIKEILAE